MATITGLPPSNRAKVFRLVEQRLRDDPALRRAGAQFQAGRGRGDDKARFPKGVKLGIQLRPTFGQADWYGFDAQRVPLVIEVSIDIEGSDYDDPMNVWLGITRALYAADPTARLAFQKSLRDAGAVTGEIDLFAPAEDPSAAPEDNRWHAVGMMRLDVKESLTGQALP